MLPVNSLNQNQPRIEIIELSDDSEEKIKNNNEIVDKQNSKINDVSLRKEKIKVVINNCKNTVINIKSPEKLSKNEKVSKNTKFSKKSQQAKKKVEFQEVDVIDVVKKTLKEGNQKYAKADFKGAAHCYASVINSPEAKSLEKSSFSTVIVDLYLSQMEMWKKEESPSKKLKKLEKARSTLELYLKNETNVEAKDKLRGNFSSAVLKFAFSTVEGNSSLSFNHWKILLQVYLKHSSKDFGFRDLIDDALYNMTACISHQEGPQEKRIMLEETKNFLTHNSIDKELKESFNKWIDETISDLPMIDSDSFSDSEAMEILMLMKQDSAVERKTDETVPINALIIDQESLNQDATTKEESTISLHSEEVSNEQSISEKSEEKEEEKTLETKRKLEMAAETERIFKKRFRRSRS